MEKSRRPWGKYTVIKEESNFKLKMIEVNPGQRLSYQYHNKRSEVWTIVEGKGEVTIDDKEKVIDMAADMDIPQDQEILHVIPQYFSIDGQMGIREPVGMAGKRLAVNIHLITCSSTAKKNLNKCIENSLIDADEYVLQPVASSYSVLTEEERTLGVCLVDIGGGTTDIAIFTDGNIKHTAVVPIAGQNITKDIGSSHSFMGGLAPRFIFMM